MTKTAPDLSLRRWSGLEGLRNGLTAWPDLSESCTADVLCNSPDWILPYAECFVQGDSLFGWTMEEAGEPVAFLPFRIEPSRGRFSMRRAIHAADGTFDSDYLDLCVRSGREEPAAERLLEALSSEAGLDAVVLAGVPEASPALAALRNELEKKRLPYRERPSNGLAAPLPDTFETYLAGLKSRMRSKVRQALRAAEHRGARFAWCDEPSSLDRHLDELFELHQKRWNAVGRPGSFGDEPRRAFYRRVARDFLSRGRLRFSRLELDGRPVAYQIGLLAGGAYYQLQEGFDPAPEDFRTATALRAMGIRRMIEEGVRSYDFMGGEARHKRDWGADTRACVTLAFALPRPRARLAYALRQGIDRIRRR